MKMSDSERKDHFLNEVDEELRSLNTRLKKVFSETEELLREHRGETDSTDLKSENGKREQQGEAVIQPKEE